MKVGHIIVAMLVAIAVALTPLGSASAGLRLGGVSQAGQIHLSEEANSYAATGKDMSDCEKMKHASGKHRAETDTPGNSTPAKSDCPCCEKNSGCAPEFCMFKCFQMVGAMPMHDEFIPAFLVLRSQFKRQDRPPDWLDGPQPPPPRA